MSYDQKITSVKQIIEVNNQNAVEKNKISFEKFLEILQSLGGTTEEALSLCTWEDLETCGLPRLLAKQVSMKLFRQFEAEGAYNQPSIGKVYVSDKKAQQMSIKELVEAYNPKDATNAVGKRLKDLSSGKRCIIFAVDGKVDIVATVDMIEDLSNGLPELEMTYIGGVPTTVYKVGERTDLYADENPLYPGRALRNGSICDQTGRSWEGVSLNIRQLLYIAIMDTKELSVIHLIDANSIIDRAVSQEAEKLIIGICPKASLRYQQLAKVGKLPILKIKLGGLNSSDKPNHPFYAQNKEF